MKIGKRTAIIIFITAFAIVTVGVFLYILSYYNLIPARSYMAEDFGIETLSAAVDYDKDGIDDYTDILLGARADAENKPKYDGAYQQGGYPPDEIGVCTDVVWRAFKNAGYSLRDMVDKDIAARAESYTAITKPDSNIDFRRVVNLRVFFEEYAVSLTLDTSDIAEWQPGDIVIFGNDKHIGIVSDKRNSDGEPYIIHNGGQPVREEDYLKRAAPTGHYRFDASLVSEEMLLPWQE